MKTSQPVAAVRHFLLLKSLFAAMPLVVISDADFNAQAQIPQPVETAAGAVPVELDWSTANRGSVSVDVKEKMSGKISQNNFKTDYGSYDRDQLRVKRMEVNVRNFGRVPASAIVETLWFVRPERPPKTGIGAAGTDLFLGERSIEPSQQLGPGGNLQKEVSNSVKSNRTRYEVLGESSASGLKFAGWLVLVRQDAKVLAYKTNTPALAALITSGRGKPMNDQLTEYAKESGSR